ncbi:MAG: TlpA disulfide reductase family protein [Bryobacteraceae bacterium]|jgi:thiol-disulfide isomerase/thioredoxin
MKGLLLLGAVALLGTVPGGGAQQPGAQAAAEQQDLASALSEAGANPLEYLRALERHLAKYPDTPRRAELERAAARAAIEAGDDPAIILYGERVLARLPDDVETLDRVARALSLSEEKDTAGRALKYARHFEELLRQMQADPAHGGVTVAEWRDRTDRALARALCYEARAAGTLGRADDALALARRSVETYANAESARELARSYERMGKFADAARALADAFTVTDPRNTDEDKARDRQRMGELYRHATGSEAGLGDLVLAAYDRNQAGLRARQLRLRAEDPNAQLKNAMEFTLSRLDGPTLRLDTLKGKVLVLDFWATWCGPCREQHPLYAEVEKRFAANANVAFLSVNADEDRTLVKPFLSREKWTGPVYFEDGLAHALAVMSLPTTLIVGKDGKVFSRLTGYVVETFVDTLTERIREALGQ